MVNDHVVSVAGTEQCVLYDTEQQKPLKTLSYDYCSAGFFSVKDQFIVYGNEIKYCLNKETLEEQEPEAGKRFMNTGMEEPSMYCLFLLRFMDRPVSMGCPRYVRENRIPII